MQSKIIDSRGAGALIEDAGLRPGTAAGLRLLGLGGAAGVPLLGLGEAADALAEKISAYKEAHGGLWVGGRVTLTADEFTFHPNGLNRVLNAGTLDVAVPLGLITDVRLIPAFVTKIVAVHVGEAVIKVRCYGARDLVELVRTAARPHGRLDPGPPA